MGVFKTGNPGKPVGSKNKVTEELRTKITEFANNNFETIVKDFNSIKSKPQKIQLYTNLLKFVLPIMKRVELDAFSIKVGKDLADQLADETYE